MSRQSNGKPNETRPKAKLGLPDLDYSKGAVLDGLRLPESKRGYRHSIDEFIQSYCSEPRLSFNKIVALQSYFWIRYVGLPDAPFVASNVSPNLLRRWPEMNPRTERACHSVADIISATVALSLRRMIARMTAFLPPSRGVAGLLEFFALDFTGFLGKLRHVTYQAVRRVDLPPVWVWTFRVASCGLQDRSEFLGGFQALLVVVVLVETAALEAAKVGLPHRLPQFRRQFDLGVLRLFICCFHLCPRCSTIHHSSAQRRQENNRIIRSRWLLPDSVNAPADCIFAGLGPAVQFAPEVTGGVNPPQFAPTRPIYRRQYFIPWLRRRLDLPGWREFRRVLPPRGPDPRNSPNRAELAIDPVGVALIGRRYASLGHCTRRYARRTRLRRFAV